MTGSTTGVRRRLFAALLALGIGGGASTANAGYADIVVDEKTGKVLSSTNADTLNHPASLTKMMTLYLVFEALHDGRLRWDQKIIMSKNGARTIPTKLGIRAGKTFTVREGVNGMIVKSANDAAEALGDHLGGSEDKFARMMTRKARALGMKRTVFYNASGLPHKKQVTTARDMAKLGTALRRDFPKEYQLFSQSSFRFRGKRIRGHNNLMYRYRGMDGIKTGYTNASGFNIVSAVHDGNRHVVSVVLGGRTARSRDARMAQLLDAAMKKASTKPVQVASLDRKATAATAKAPNRKGVSIEAVIAETETSLATMALAAEPMASGGAWEIQIAATDTKAQATRLLAKARKSINDDFPGIRARTETVSRDGSTLHRARLAGFDSQQTAKAACSALTARSYDCMVVN